MVTAMRMVIARVCVMVGTANAQMWQDATADCTGTTAEWSNKLEHEDLDAEHDQVALLA